jgi:hypothetical protein
MFSEAYPRMSDSPPPDIHYPNTSSFQGIPDPSVVGSAPDTPPISSQPALAGLNILSITTSQLQAIHTGGGSYNPTPVSDAPGLFEQTTEAGDNPLPTLPLDVALAMVAPYEPTPSYTIDDNNRRAPSERLDDEARPFPITQPQGDLTQEDVRTIYTIMQAHLPAPPTLPSMFCAEEDRLTPRPGPTKEARLVTQELLTELLNSCLGYAGYCLASDLEGCTDLNIPFDALELTDHAHALVCALDAGMEHGHDNAAPYTALPQRDWFRLANALIAAIICGSIRTRGFSQMKLINSDVLPDPCLLGPGVDMLITTGAFLQALAEQLAGEIDIRNDRSTGEQIVTYFDWVKEQAMVTACKLAELEARADTAPSLAQIERWEKEAVHTLKEEFHTAFLQSTAGVQAMEKMVQNVQEHEVTVKARRNVVQMVETGLLNNRGEMVGIEREAKANLMACFSAESSNQEDEWRRAYFERLMERLKGRHTDARLVPDETASQFVRDISGAINAEVESHVDRLIRTIELTAKEAYAEETSHIVARAELKARHDAKEQADLAYKTIFDRDMKVNHALSDISLENIRKEFRVQLEVQKEHTRKECAEAATEELDVFQASVSRPHRTFPNEESSVMEVAQWAKSHGYRLLENTDEERSGKCQDLGQGRKRDCSGSIRSRSSSITSWGPLPSPKTPKSGHLLSEMMDDAFGCTPTGPRRPESPEPSLMAIDKSAVQQLQGVADDLHAQKKDTKQTATASLHNPNNQMAISPTAGKAAESVMSPRPSKTVAPKPPSAPPAASSSTTDPTLLAILATLTHLSGDVKGLSDRLTSVKTGTSRDPRPHPPKPTPAAAAPVSMPNRPKNPTIDLKSRVIPSLTPKANKPPLPPAAPSARVDKADAFATYIDNYDDEFPDTLPTAPTAAPSKAAPAQAAEWVEVKTRPNHKQGIINLDYTTVAQTNAVQNQAAQVKHSLNRMTTGGPMRSPGQSSGPNTTIITIVRSGGLVDNQAEENKIRQLSEQFLIMSARLAIEQITAASISVVGGWWVVKANKKGNRRRNGNFNFMVAGHVPHERILPFQHIFLEHLKVSAVVTAGNWVWENLRNVPTIDPLGNIAGPGVLLKEMRQNPILADLSFPQMPHYTCNPNNLCDTATVAFAYLDATGKVARSAGAEGVWMFGIRVQFVCTGDSPVFTQCGKCHELGHVTVGCAMTRNSSKCYRCGGAHESGSHDEKCKATTHRIGGVCDCAFPCLLCKQTGHHCRSKECPKRGPFRPPPLASAKNPNPSPAAAPPAPAAPTTTGPKPKAKKSKATTKPTEDKVLTQREEPKDSPSPPPGPSLQLRPKGQHSATS